MNVVGPSSQTSQALKVYDFFVFTYNEIFFFWYFSVILKQKNHSWPAFGCLAINIMTIFLKVDSMYLPDLGHSPASVAMNKFRNSVRLQSSRARLCGGPFEANFFGLGQGLYSKIFKYKRLNPVGQVNHLAKGPPLRKPRLPVGTQIYLKPWYRARRNKYISLPEFLPPSAVFYRLTDTQLLKLTHFSEFLRRA